MRTSRYILYTALGTVLCLFYVFQQTEIVKLGYRITTADKVLEACLDRRIALEYVVSKLESPLHIDSELFLKGENFEMPKEYRLVKLESKGDDAQLKRIEVRKASVLRRLAFSSWFAATSAEARTIK